MSVLATEINIVESSASLFAGTSFDIDITSMIRSGMAKTELSQECCKLYSFQYLNMEQFIHFMLVHNVKFGIDELNEFKAWFPMRRRQALYILHLILDQKKDIVGAFMNSETKMKEYIKSKCKSFEERMEKSRHIYMESFKLVLMKYIMHYKFPELLGSTFIVKDGQVAKNLVMSGITCPSSDNELQFYAVDALGYDFCVQYLSNMNFPYSDTPQTISSQLLTLSDREEIMEPVIGIALTSLDITLKSMIVSTKYVLQPDVIPILDCKVRCKRLFNSSSFYDYCKDNNWIDSELIKYSGEQLFFHFINKKDYQKIDQIALFPSDHNHTDIYLFYLANYTPVHFRISIKALTGNDLDIRYKSLAPELMYLNEYNTIDLETITLLRKNDTPTSVLNNFINNFSKGKQELKKQIGNGSSNEDQSTTVNEIESNINENDNSVESTFNELESIKELDTDSEFDLFVKNIKEANNSKLNEWWESSRCQVWESIKKGVSLNVIIRLHPNKEVERLSRNKYSNIICIGKQSFSTLFPYLSNSVETFLQNQRINTSKPLL